MRDVVTIVSLTERDRWVAEHREGGLPSQSWSYAWGLSASGVNPKLAIVRSGGARMLMPFFERQWMGSTDIATILGASGASIVPNSTAPLALWRKFAAAQGWVAGYIQLSPFVDLEEPDPDGEIVANSTMFLLDLRTENIPNTVSRTIRRKLQYARNSGADLVDDRSVLAKSLKRLYPSTMQRLGAPPHFNFLPATLDRWAADPESVVLGASLEGNVEAVYLFRVTGRLAEAHITGTTAHGRQLAAWLICEGIHRLREIGVTMLNLGGGVRQGDGISRFKERFNGMARARRAVRQIYDQRRYDALCSNAGISSRDRWFPAYRTPTES